MKTRCLVIDDEPLARSLMRIHIEKLGSLELIAECSDAMKAVEVLRTQKIDLMFLDIQMPQLTGIEFLKTLMNPPKVIITTAHRDYAIEGFELDVVDYLLKPITFERFLKSVNKYFQMQGNEAPVPEEPAQPSNAGDEHIYVKENKRMVKIFLHDILYIEGLSEYVKIYTPAKKIVTKTSLTHFEEILQGKDFLRIHKSYIVALNKIDAFTSVSIEISGKELPVGRSYKEKVVQILQNSGQAITS